MSAIYKSGTYYAGGGSAALPSGGTTGQALVKKTNSDGDVQWADVSGVPDGGTTGQSLLKKSNSDQDVEWGDVDALPSGGTAGQFLKKKSNSDGDAEWDDVEALPSGGTTGQFLKKKSSTDGDAEWGDVQALPTGGTTGQVLAKRSNTDGDAEWVTVESIQVETIPAASASLEGKCVQYLGTTNSTYTHGLFYECYEDTSSTPSTYNWRYVRVETPENVTISYADFQNLSQAEKDNGTAYFVPDVPSIDKILLTNLFDRASIYTETERVVGAFLGKPLYQKTLLVESLTNNTWNTIPHNITNLEKVLDFYGACYLDCGGGSFKWLKIASSIGDGDTYSLYAAVSSSGVQIYAGTYCAWATGSYGYVTLQYTKTTDSSDLKVGTANDYSMQEMVVGSWIDGKRLYQKTLTGTGHSTSNSWFSIGNVSTLLPNLSKVIQANITGEDNRSLGYRAGVAYECFISDEGNINVKQKFGSSDETFTYYLTVQYTKMTD